MNYKTLPILLLKSVFPCMSLTASSAPLSSRNCMKPKFLCKEQLSILPYFENKSSISAFDVPSVLRFPMKILRLIALKSLLFVFLPEGICFGAGGLLAGLLLDGLLLDGLRLAGLRLAGLRLAGLPLVGLLLGLRLGLLLGLLGIFVVSFLYKNLFNMCKNVKKYNAHQVKKWPERQYYTNTLN